jgi:hypothetical protein
MNLAGEKGKVQKKTNKDNAPKSIEIPLPQTYEEALDIIHRFEAAGKDEEMIKDSVAFHAFRNQGSLLDEKWNGSEDDERLAWVTEGALFTLHIC